MQQTEQFNLEQAAQIIKKMPLEDLDKLQQIIENERQAKREKEEKAQKLRFETERFKLAEKWLRENREKYMGQWVCLDGDTLIAYGINGLLVHAEAKAAGIEAPFLEHIVEEEKFFTGAWL